MNTFNAIGIPEKLDWKKISQIKAFATGKTAYPKWCWIFSLPVGMVAAQIFNIFGNYPWVNALSCAWISVGNIWMFAGLLATMKKAQKKQISE